MALARKRLQQLRGTQAIAGTRMHPSQEPNRVGMLRNRRVRLSRQCLGIPDATAQCVLLPEMAKRRTELRIDPEDVLELGVALIDATEAAQLAAGTHSSEEIERLIRQRRVQVHQGLLVPLQGGQEPRGIVKLDGRRHGVALQRAFEPAAGFGPGVIVQSENDPLQGKRFRRVGFEVKRANGGGSRRGDASSGRSRPIAVKVKK